LSLVIIRVFIGAAKDREMAGKKDDPALRKYYLFEKLSRHRTTDGMNFTYP